MNNKPDNVTDCLMQAGLAIEKGLLILGDVTTDFPIDGDEKELMTAWKFEFGRVTKFLDIAFDYMYETSQMIQAAKEAEKNDGKAKTNLL